MRAYIKRDEDCKNLLKTISVDKDSEFHQEYWINESHESFHCEVSDTGDSVIFYDSRLPNNMELPLNFIEID